MKTALGNFIKESEEKWKPEHIQMDTVDYPVPDYDDLVFVDSAKPENIDGKYAMTYYNPVTKKIFFEYHDVPLTFEEEMKEKMAKVEAMGLSATESYNKLDLEKTNLLEVTKMKIEELKEQCTEAIFAGFTSGENEFGFNETDQSNFTQRMLTIIAGAPGPFEWKSKNNGVVELTKAEFTQAITDAEAHKLTQQKKYWALEQEVLAAGTNEEVDAVKW